MTRLLLSCSQQRTPLRSLSLRRGSAATVGRIAQGEPRPDVWVRAADIPQTALTDTSRDAEESVAGDLEPMKEERVFVKAELVRSMESGKLARERYADGFTFKDPIVSVSGLSNYSLYLGALNAVINAKCECRSVSVRNGRKLLVEWTTILRPKLPLIDPLVLTGRSIYELDDAGKVKSIQGVWDALENNDFPSLEGAAYLISSLVQVRLTPELETPRYRILRRLKEYEVREYEPFVVAEVAMPKGSNAVSGAGFTKLAAYTFGSNEESVRMEMTTPVYTTPGQGPVRGKMAFVMEEKYWQDPAALPTPKASDVQTGTQHPRLTAAICFSGFPLNSEVSGNEQRLRKLLEEDGLQPEPGFQLARYNEPTAPPFLRRNEVLIKLADVSELPQPPRSPRS